MKIIRVKRLFALYSNGLLLPKFSVLKTLLTGGVFSVILSLLVVPLKITVDGSLYISSAKSLYSIKMPEHYHWVREPFYPVLIRFINDYFGSSDLGIIFLQSLFLSSAIIIVSYVILTHFQIKYLNMFSVFIYLFLIINPFYLLFAGLVLQQSLFAIYLAIFLLLIFVSQSELSTRKLIIFYTFFLVFYIISVLTSPVFVYIGVIALVVSLYYSGKFRYKSENLRTQFKVYLNSTLIFLLIILSANLSVSLWNDFRINSTASLNIVSGEILNEPIDIPVSEIILEVTENPSDTLIDYIDRYAALLHFKKDATWNFSELEIYSELMLFSGWRCGAVDPFSLEPYASFSQDYFTPNCRSEKLHSWYAKISELNPYSYWIAILSFLLMTLLSIKRLDLKFLGFLIIPIIFLTSYVFIDAGLDRYGIPIYSWGVASFIALFNVYLSKKPISIK